MPDRVTPADPGLLASLADQISLPGFAIRNAIRGDFGAAGRNLADFGLNLVDAPLPGDWIPEISGEKDRPETRDVLHELGVGTPDGFAGEALNFAGNVLTDPLTFVPGAAVAKGLGATGKAIKAVTPKAVQNVAAKAGKVIRKTAGAERIGKPLQNVITRAQGAKETAARASQEPIVEGLKGASKRELEAAGEVMLNITKDKATQAMRAIDETDTMSVQDRLAKYLAENPDVNADKLAKIIETSSQVARGQWESGQAGNIFTKLSGQPDSDVVMGAVPGSTGSKGVEGYFPRIFKNEDPEAAIQDLIGQPSAIKGRKLDTSKDVLEYLANHPEISLTTNAAEVLGQRAGQQGELAARGATGQGLMDLARAGDMALPDELLAKALAQQRMAQPARAVVGQSGEAMGADVADMLSGGARQGPRAAPPNISDPYDWPSKGILGNILDPENSMNKWQAGQNMEEVAMGLGTQSGKSVVGKSTAPAPTGLSDADRKSAREWLLSKEYKQADPLMRETAEAIAKNLPGDEADVALHFLKGIKGRTGIPKALAALNSRFKPVAVFGALVPKLGSITRNMTGGVWQKYSNPEARGAISPKNIPGFLRDWWASMEDGVERLLKDTPVSRALGRDRIFTKNEFAQVDEAFKLGAGDPRKALAAIKDPVMRGAVERGVLGNNFVDTEGLIAQTQRSGALKFAERAWDYPAAMFKGAEGRMRYGLYKSLVQAGKSEDDAARIVRESLYDYTQSSMENRLARDVIPFFQFMAKSIPQQAGLMAEKPWLASTVANAYAPGRDEPVSPMMEGKLNIPLGEDEQGNRQYLSNLGLPFESLSMLPNFSANPLQTGRDVEQSVVGSLTPLLKTAYAYTTGQDPTFGSTPGSYTKVAGQDLGAVGGFLNQLAGTGIAPLTAAQQIASLAGRATDDRTTIGEKVLNNLTGARVQSVDPDRAIQQRLQSYLERSPDIGQFRTFFSQDPDAQELLRNLAEARKALKEKQKAAASVN